MKILLIHKEEENDSCQDLIAELVENFNTEIIEREHFEKSMLDGKDIVITLGGDGTFVTAAQVSSIPILGINSNPEKSEGVLTKFKIQDKEKVLSLLKNKNWKIEAWPAIEAEINNKIININGVNEVYIGSYKHYHMSRYKIKLNDKEENQKSSGIIITNSIGSTAWYKSAGGKPFNNIEEIKFLVREPYQGNIHKPSILNDNAENIEIEVLNKIGVLVFDSEKEIPLKKHDMIKIRLIKDKIKRII